MTTILSCGHYATFDEEFLITNAKMCSWEESVVDEERGGHNLATAWGTICNECLQSNKERYTILTRQTMYGCSDN